MARWRLYWLVSTLVYATPLLVLIAAHAPYQTPSNLAVAVGPPVVAFGLGWLLWR